MSTKRSILLLAGEASGDHHAAALVRDLKELDPTIRVTGIGGDKLADAGMELLHHYREINTIALSEGLKSLGRILAAYRTMKRELQSGRHQVFVPVDYPDVNLRLCKIAKDAGVRVCYYISPQVWAWRKGRIRKIRARVDRMMTIFPFEEKMYREAGVNADFVGHTMIRDIPAAPDRDGLRGALGIDPQCRPVALVPGSRPAEITRMLPVMCEAARLHLKEYPDACFLLPLAGQHLSEMVHSIAVPYELPLTVHSEDAAKVMAACESGLVTSGTATLQAALVGMPHAVTYIVDRLTWLFGLKILKPLVMDKDIHVAIANVLAIKHESDPAGPLNTMLEAGYRIPCRECGRPLFVPELLQDQATPGNLAAWLGRFRSDSSLSAAMKRGFEALRQMLSPGAETPRAARIVMEYLDR